MGRFYGQRNALRASVGRCKNRVRSARSCSKKPMRASDYRKELVGGDLVYIVLIIDSGIQYYLI